MPSLMDIVVSFLAALLSAAFLHFGAAEKPDDTRTDKTPEAATLIHLTEAPETETLSAAVKAPAPLQSQNDALKSMKFLAY